MVRRERGERERTSARREMRDAACTPTHGCCLACMWALFETYSRHVKCYLATASRALLVTTGGSAAQLFMRAAGFTDCSECIDMDKASLSESSAPASAHSACCRRSRAARSDARRPDCQQHWTDWRHAHQRLASCSWERPRHAGSALAMLSPLVMLSAIELELAADE